MILYLDTSALVKRYFKEPFSDEIISQWKKAEGIVTSSVAYAEAMACFCRKKREGKLEDELIKTITGSFRRDWNSFIRVEVTDDLNEHIDKTVREYPLRGFDAIHLASAMVVFEKLADDFLFACFDYNLMRAAQSEGFKTFPSKQT